MRGSFSRGLLNVFGAALACSIALPASAQPHHTPHHSVHLAWQPGNASSKTIGYNVYRSIDGHEKFRKLNASPVPKPKYDDMTVRSGVTYLYIVKSVNAKGVESGPSNQIRLSVPR